jgi:glycerol uptake facilitator-like aquaporin
MLFGVTSIVRWVIGPSPISLVIPQINTKLLNVGAGVALLLAGLILSPPGKASGGHMNPAISFAMWRFGIFPGAFQHDGPALIDVAVNRMELSMSPTIKLAQAIGFNLWAMKAVLTRRGNELIDLAASNLIR